MKLVEGRVPEKCKGAYNEILMEFISSGMKSALVQLEPGDNIVTPRMLHNCLRNAAERNPLLYEQVKVVMRGSSIYLCRADYEDEQEENENEAGPFLAFTGKPFVSIKEAARLSGLSVYYWRNLVNDKVVEHIRSGNKFYIDYNAAMQSIHADAEMEKKA